VKTFRIERADYSADAMRTSNADDDALLHWIDTCEPGDTFPAFVRCECIADESIPAGEAIEITPELIVVTSRTFAPRATATAVLATGATMAIAHPGHDSAPAHDPGAVIWFACAMVAAACMATVRTIGRREVQS
jgi:hypothetical protein